MLVFAFTRKDRRRALYFSMLTMAILLYTLGYMLEINATTPGEAMMALRIENAGIPLVAPFFLLTALGFYQPRLLRPWMTKVSSVYGAVMFLLIFFNERHLLYYSSIDLVYNGSFYALSLGKGPLYLIQQLVSGFCMALVCVLVLERFFRGSAKLRSQMSFFIIGAVGAFAANLANQAGLIPMRLDLMPFSLTMGLVFFAIVLRRHRLMDIVPVAFDMSIENLDDAVIILDSEWGFIYCNQRARKLFPALISFSGAEEIVRVDGWPPELNPQSEKEIRFSVETAEGNVTIQQAYVNNIRDDAGRLLGVSVFIRDITELTDMFKQIEALAITDHLTGVFNRRHFMTLVEGQMEMARRHDLPVSILMLDIDYFKQVNDTYSHIAGDHVLCEMANVLTREMRSYDVIARYGGEEFIILSMEKNPDNLKIFANRLREAVEKETIAFDDATINITASFGAVLIMPGQSFEAGLVAVDKALYEAKNSGRNKVVIGEINTRGEAVPLEQNSIDPQQISIKDIGGHDE
jgi:diguanylate cyclase (GGDEF) domain